MLVISAVDVGASRRLYLGRAGREACSFVRTQHHGPSRTRFQVKSCDRDDAPRHFSRPPETRRMTSSHLLCGCLLGRSHGLPRYSVGSLVAPTRLFLEESEALLKLLCLHDQVTPANQRPAVPALDARRWAGTSWACCSSAKWARRLLICATAPLVVYLSNNCPTVRCRT